MNRRVAARAIILHDGKLLGVRLKEQQGEAPSEPKDYWCTPGGGVDIGEPLTAALEREVIEELGIKPVVGNLLYMQQFIENDTEHLEFFYHITNGADFLHINLGQTTHGNIELAEVGFVDPATVKYLPEFLQTEPIAEHAANGAAPKLFDNISKSVA